MDTIEDDLASQATLWVVRLTSGEPTAEELRRFEQWRDSSPAHAHALNQARSLWLMLGQALEPAQSSARAPSPAKVHIGRRFQIGALAASIAACAVLAFQSYETWAHDYVTGAGERRAVTLADGTRVLMNGRSAMDVSFEGGVRQVTLARGEAYFEVTHDPKRPFTVAAGAGYVRDVGTAFSVRSTEDGGASVLVARGEVEVDSPVAGVVPANVKPDQSVAYAHGWRSPVRRVNAARDLSWVHGRVVLENRSLADAVDEIGRFYGGRLILLDKSVGTRRINAVIDLDRTDDWLDALGKTHTAKVTRLGSLVLIY